LALRVTAETGRQAHVRSIKGRDGRAAGKETTNMRRLAFGLATSLLASACILETEEPAPDAHFDGVSPADGPVGSGYAGQDPDPSVSSDVDESSKYSFGLTVGVHAIATDVADGPVFVGVSDNCNPDAVCLDDASQTCPVCRPGAPDGYPKHAFVAFAPPSGGFNQPGDVTGVDGMGAVDPTAFATIDLPLGAHRYALAGTFSAPMLAGTTTLSPVGGKDAYLVGFHRDGSVHAATRFGGPGDERISAIVDAGDFGTIVAGTFTSSMTCGATTISSGGWGHGAFVARLSMSGACTWIRAMPAQGPVVVKAMTRSSNGDVAIVGSYESTFSAGTAFKPTSAGGKDGFVTVWASNGTWKWGRSFGGAMGDVVETARYMPDGDLVIAASYMGSVGFGGAPLPSVPSLPAALARYSSAGAHLWSIALVGTSPVKPQRIAVDALNDRTILMGQFHGSLNPSGGADPAAPDALTAGGLDVFAAVYSPDGEMTKSGSVGGAYGRVTSLTNAWKPAGSTRMHVAFSGVLSQHPNTAFAATASWDVAE
jgi:hypothetical protein